MAANEDEELDVLAFRNVDPEGEESTVAEEDAEADEKGNIVIVGTEFGKIRDWLGEVCVIETIVQGGSNGIELGMSAELRQASGPAETSQVYQDVWQTSSVIGIRYTDVPASDLL